MCASHTHTHTRIYLTPSILSSALCVCVVITLVLLISQTVKARRHPVLSCSSIHRSVFPFTHPLISLSVYLPDADEMRSHLK